MYDETKINKRKIIMGIFGSMALLTIGAYMFLFLVMKVFGSTQKENKSTHEAIQRDNDEFNKY